MSTSDSLVNQALAKVLRGLKAESGLTLDDLEERSGLSKSTVRRMLRGTGDISMTGLTALTAAMSSTAEKALSRVFADLDYDTAYQDAVGRISGRQMSDVPESIASLDQKREAALLDAAHIDGTERIAADINDEADHDEPEAP